MKFALDFAPALPELPGDLVAPLRDGQDHSDHQADHHDDREDQPQDLGVAPSVEAVLEVELVPCDRNGDQEEHKLDDEV